MTARQHGSIREISSPSNNEIKAIRSLHLKKYRDREGLFLAEGLKLVLEAIDAGWPPQKLIVTKKRDDDGDTERRDLAVETVLSHGGDVLSVSPGLLAKISKRDNPQSVIGVFEKRFCNANLTGREGLWVALDRVRDPGNLGTIVRTLDVAGADGLVLVGQCCDPFSLETVRATMGSIFKVPIAVSEPETFLQHAKDIGARLIGTHLADATIDFKRADYDGNVILLMGNEQKGLSDVLSDGCDQLVRIPMRNGADSLNLAVSTGLMIYEALRARHGDH